MTVSRRWLVRASTILCAAFGAWSIAQLLQGTEDIGETERIMPQRQSVPASRPYLPKAPTFSDPATAPDSVPNQVLVKFASSTTPSRIQSIAKSIGAEQEQAYRTPGLLMFSLPDDISTQQAKSHFRSFDEVERVENDLVYSIDDIPNDPDFPLLWGLHNTGQDGGVEDVDINAPEAWNEITDSGEYVIAIIDSGADLDHPDLVDSLWTNPFEIPDNEIDDDGNGHVDDIHGIDQISFDGEPEDNLGHGTHVAGTIGATGNNGTGISGVFWNSQLMHCKVFSSWGWTTLSRILTCMDYVIWAFDSGINVVAVNASWSGSYSQLLEDAVLEFDARDILIVTSAGNEAEDIDVAGWYPAAYPYDNIIAVAAIDRIGDVPLWSNFGAQNVDIAAPGVDIWSTWYHGDWRPASGTSMAAPHVTGTVGLVKAATPSLSMTEVRNHVLNSGVADPRYDGLVASGSRVRIELPVVDTDGDGMTDRWETRFGLDPLDPGDAALDADADGLTNLEEFLATTHPDNADTDGDALSDFDELNVYGSDPKMTDTDEDGIGDFDETQTYGTNPASADSDGDGWNDFDEINISGTDPLDADMDGDGLLDGFELDNGFDPLAAGEETADPDGDGLTSFEEQAVGTDPNNFDTDEDSAGDGQEVLLLGTNPLDRDSDDDDIDDGWESSFGLDPLQAADGILDNDSDGYTNRAEFRGESDPLVRASVPPPIPWGGLQADARHSAYIPVHTVATEFGERWVQQLPLEGRERQPVVGRQSITGAAFIDGEKVIGEFDLRDGSLVQAHPVAQGFGPNDLQQTLGNLYGISYDSSIRSSLIFSIDPDTGEEVFPAINIGGDTAPALTAYEGKLYVKIDAEMVEFDATTGAERWRSAIPGVSPDSFSPPAVNDLYVGIISQSALQVYERTTGQHLHTVDIENCTQHDDQIVFDDANEALVSCFTRLTAIDLEQGIANWSIDTLRSTLMATDPEFVYVTSYLGLHVLNRSTGEHQWTWFSDINSIPSGNVLVTLDHVFVTNPFSTIAIDLKTHEPVWEVELGGYIYMNRDGALVINPAYTNQILVVDTSGDLDGDGALDWWEKYFGLDFAEAADGVLDMDGDGLSNAAEYVQGSNPTVGDTDGDGLNDGDEVAVYQTDPSDSDSDNDGLSDGDEVLIYGSDPRHTDTDGDDFSDGDEVSRNADPTDPGSQPILADDYFESFENGLPSGWTMGSDGVVGFDVSSDLATNGSFALQSQERPARHEYASITFTDNFRAGDLHFDAHVAEEAESGRLEVFVDDRLVGEKIDSGWTRMSIYVPHGRHTIKFRYRDTVTLGPRATIDNLRYEQPLPYGSNIDNVLGLANNMLYEIRTDGSLARAPIWIPGDKTHHDFVMAPDHRVIISANGPPIIYDPVLETFSTVDPYQAVESPSSIVKPVTATENSLVVSGVGSEAPLYKYNLRGAILDSVFTGTSFEELEFGRDGWLYGLRSHQGEVHRLDPQTLASQGIIQLATRETNGFAVDSLGRYYSASRENPAGSQVRIEVFSPLGELLDTHELETINSLRDPELTDNGHLFFGGAAGEVHRLRKDFRSSQRFEIDLVGGNLSMWVASVPKDGPDEDLDGIPDWWERANALDQKDPTDAAFDQDADGLTNAEEFAVNGNPNVVDTDGDGLIDGEEVNVYGTDPTVSDTDLDGLDDGAEVNDRGTDPADEDTDGDGLTDGDEILIVGSDPMLVDTDGDGISDAVEFQHRMSVDDPADSSADFDGDGITNSEELLRGTSIRNRDSDRDGLTDETEIRLSLTDPLRLDTDGDRLPDGWEFRNGLDPNSDDAADDADLDGFRNEVEFLARTHPTSAISVPTHKQWETDQGDIKHRGFVPMRLDIDNLVVKWHMDPTDESDRPLSPATISREMLFTTTHEPLRFDYILSAIDRETGSLAWEYKFSGVGFASPPANDGVSAFVQTSHHDNSFIWSFDQATGDINFQVPYSNQITTSRSPLPYNGSLYIPSGYFGGIARHDATTGEEIWQMDHDSGDGHTLTIVDEDVFSYSMEQGLLRINIAETGERKHSIKDETFAWSGYTTYSSIVQGSYGNLILAYGTGIVSFDLAERRTQWLAEFDASWQLGMALGPGVVFGVEPRALVAFDERDGRELWRWNSARFIRTDPVVTLDHVFIGTDIATFAIDIETGESVWTYPVGGSVSVSDDLDMYISGHSGELAAIQTQVDTDGDDIPDDWEIRNAMNPNDPNDAESDLDSDGLSLFEEFLLRTNPNSQDTDSDGLSDLAETRTHNSDPLQPDTDGDGFSDGDEVQVYGTRPDHLDTDGDGLQDDYEANVLSTDPTLTDTDGDGFADNVELRLGSDPTTFASVPPLVTEFYESFESGDIPPRFENGSSNSHWWTTDTWSTPDGHIVARPTWVETWASAEMTWEDNFAGGLLTFDLYSRNTFCCDDLEVLIDGQQVFLSAVQTDWQTISVDVPAGHRRISWRFFRNVGNDINQLQTFVDSIRFRPTDEDNDGMPISWELEHGFDPNDPSDASADPDLDGLTNLEEYQAGTLPRNADSDSDGMPDGWEVENGLNPTSLSDRDDDPDGDSLGNYDEYIAGTSPNAADSDGDGMPDGWEVTFGLDATRSNGGEDADGDGATNFEEYQYGSDPTDAASAPPNTGGGGSGGGSSGGGTGGSGGGGGSPDYLLLLALLGIAAIRTRDCRRPEAITRSRCRRLRIPDVSNGPL